MLKQMYQDRYEIKLEEESLDFLNPFDTSEAEVELVETEENYV